MTHGFVESLVELVLKNIQKCYRLYSEDTLFKIELYLDSYDSWLKCKVPGQTTQKTDDKIKQQEITEEIR